jgi:hypothetical protein
LDGQLTVECDNVASRRRDENFTFTWARFDCIITTIILNTGFIPIVNDVARELGEQVEVVIQDEFNTSGLAIS